jgi:HD-GYP domain-containing protein (c-di-GMP phosphodiesterase class II)
MTETHETNNDACDQTEVEKQHMATKQIPVDALSPGMYVVGLDRPWHDSITLIPQRIEGPAIILKLKEYGVRYVTIDPTLGKDVNTTEGDALPTPQKERLRSGGQRVQKFAGLEEDLGRAQMVRTEAMTMVESIFEGVKTGAPINSVTVKRTVTTLMDIILHNYDPFLSVLHMRQYDANLFVHAVNVCAFALIIGKSQGFDKPRLECLGVGALLHDVGKLRLPRNLFRKQGAYTPQERQLIQQHPLLGATILAEAQDIREESRRIVLEHHERIDGSGYPAGRHGLEISPLSEIVSIVDIYDAMLSGREGRPVLPPTQAIRELYKYGLKGHCDRGWIERTIRCLGIYPIGSLVELSTGERGVVVQVNPLDALRPTVKIVWNPTGQAYPVPVMLDLSMPRTLEQEQTIVRALDPIKEHVNIAPYLEGGR